MIVLKKIKVILSLIRDKWCSGRVFDFRAGGFGFYPMPEIGDF
jgi:hypothetical protein